MDEQIDVSVIVPVFNGEKYIKRCLDSILSQSNILFEIIVVDDGSTDNTKKIINQYHDDSRINYLSQRNSGVSSARNLGIRNSRGKYIIFVDADDYILPDSLSKRIEAISDYELLISGIRMVADETVLNESIPSDETKDISFIDALRSISPQSEIGYQGFAFNKVFLREIIKSNQIFFNEQILYGEDRLFVAQYITECKKILVSPDVVYCYEQNNDGAMAAFKNINSENERKIITEFDGLELMEAIVKPYDISIFYTFRYYEFRQALRFIKNAERTAGKLKRMCMFIIFSRSIDVIRYLLIYLLPKKIRRK